MQMFQNAQSGMPTVSHEKLFRQRLRQGLWELAMMIHWGVCRDCVSCRKFDDSVLVERREMWTKLAKIGSMDFFVSRAIPERNR